MPGKPSKLLPMAIEGRVTDREPTRKGRRPSFRIKYEYIAGLARKWTENMTAIRSV